MSFYNARGDHTWRSRTSKHLAHKHNFDWRNLVYSPVGTSGWGHWLLYKDADRSGHPIAKIVREGRQWVVKFVGQKRNFRREVIYDA